MKNEKNREIVEYLKYLADLLFTESERNFIKGSLSSLIENKEHFQPIVNEVIEFMISEIKRYGYERRKIKSERSIRAKLEGFKKLLSKIGELAEDTQYYSQNIGKNLRDLSEIRKYLEEKLIEFQDFWWKIMLEAFDPRNTDKEIRELSTKFYKKFTEFENVVKNYSYRGETIKNKLYKDLTNLVSNEIIKNAIGKVFPSPEGAYENGYNLVSREILPIVKPVIEEINKYNEIYTESAYLVESVKRLYQRMYPWLNVF